MSVKISLGSPDNRKAALRLIILFGLVSLFGDIVYEGARSVNGPYLKTLGTSAALVGLIAGIGEFFGYAVRLLSGYLTDKTKSYWLFTIVGYALLISVPLLSLTGTWQFVAVLIVMERFGKAIRGPARDTILSQAAKQIGTGFGFGITEALDQIGALTGPLIFTFLFFSMGPGSRTIADYQRGYGLLWIPFIAVMAAVFFAWRSTPEPQKFEASSAEKAEKLSKIFWLYTLFSFIATFGFMNFILIGYHFKAQNIISDVQIPFLYAIAMAVDGVAALAVGKAYDLIKRFRAQEAAGLLTLVIIPFFSLMIPLLVLAKSYMAILGGVIIWGIVMGAHETIMKSAIADITPFSKRGTGYGIFNTAYGVAMLLGSVLMGVLYDYSLSAVIAAVVIIELCAGAVFVVMYREVARQRRGPFR